MVGYCALFNRREFDAAQLLVEMPPEIGHPPFGRALARSKLIEPRVAKHYRAD